jgi:hypothetical protein
LSLDFSKFSINLFPKIIIWAWGSLEADFKRFYDLDLNYIHKNNLITWRKFLILVRGLPEDSAYNRWYNDKENRNFVEAEEVIIK